MNKPRSGDQLFIKKLTDLVLANLAREDFNVGRLARIAGMSRSSVHRRLKEIKNQNATQFIREIRLQRAMEMLQKDLGTASEIAYRVGFGSPAYFTKCFHEYFGFPPGEVKRMDSGEDDNDGEVGGQRLVSAASGHYDSGLDGVKGKQKRRIVLTLTALIAVPVIALALVVIFSDIFSLKARGKSIVVLPFKNLTSDPGNQYFADGIMEDILDNLYHISDLRVISRTTSEHFRDTDMTSGDIGRELNAHNVLEGSIRRDGDNIRVSVQLIDANRDQHIWSQNFDRNVTDLLGVQGEIAMKIADRLKTVITDSEAAQMKEMPTQNPEAYDNYLRARFLLHKANSDQRFDISREGLMTSLQYYEKAIAADTTFAEAYAGLANAWFNLSAWGWYQPYIEGINNAEYYFSKALEIDPGCAEAHAVKGICLAYPYSRFEEATEELQLAISIDPNFPVARQWYAQLLMITGPIEEARTQVDRVVELEPYFWVIQNLNSWIYYFEEKYDLGLDACQTARDLNPVSADNIWLFILHYAKLGEAIKAAAELQAIFERLPSAGQYSREVMDACNESGMEGIFRWLIDLNKNNPLPVEGLNGHPFYISWWYAILGDREQSIAWLERTMGEKLIPLHYFNLITTNPDFDILRDDPRFMAILEKAGLAAYNKMLTL